MLGPTNTERVPSFRTATELLAEMDRVGIAEALVYASQARLAHPSDGNAALLDAIGNEPRLHPCWVVRPPGTGEQPDPEALVAAMRARGVRAARLFPDEHSFPLVERSLRPLLRALSAARIPLLVDTGRTSWHEIRLDWREVFAIAEAHPSLPLVLLREGGSTARVLWSVWGELPNLRLDTSYLQEARVIEEIAGRFGAERLLFGTALPRYDAGGPLGLLAGARVSEAARAGIAGDNLRRLFGLPAAAETRGPSWPCGTGGFRVFDVHTHLGRWQRKYYDEATAGELVRRMDEIGIERAATSDLLAIGPDFAAGNRRAGAAARDFAGRIVGYAVFNPNYGAESAAALARAFDEHGCGAVKLHCMLHETATDAPAYRPAFRFAQERACPVLCHTHGSPSPEFFMRLLGDHPNLAFIHAHIGGGERAPLEPFLELAHARPNFFFDQAMSAMPRGTLAWLAERVPPAQIVYGSDHPVMDFPYQLGRVLYADLPDALKRIILWDNAARIFGQAGEAGASR
jgi:predicted TIM-barrel fold metal-dependent hydrolase